MTTYKNQAIAQLKEIRSEVDDIIHSIQGTHHEESEAYAISMGVDSLQELINKLNQLVN